MWCNNCYSIPKVTLPSNHFTGINAMKPYSPPVLSDYGSIANSTFATPAAGGDPEQPGGGPFTCHSSLAGSGQPGTKSQTVLQCDKFGEYSHS